jgi:hypothetical protein
MGVETGPGEICLDMGSTLTTSQSKTSGLADMLAEFKLAAAP